MKNATKLDIDESLDCLIKKMKKNYADKLSSYLECLNFVVSSKM